NVVDGALLDGFDRQLRRSLAGDHDELGRNLSLANRLEQRDAVELRHLQVGKDDAELFAGEAVERLLTILGDLDAVAFVTENRAETGRDRLLVVGDEDLCVCVLHALSGVRWRAALARGNAMEILCPSQCTRMSAPAAAARTSAG